jgi:hypothetical protein
MEETVARKAFLGGMPAAKSDLVQLSAQVNYMHDD